MQVVGGGAKRHSLADQIGGRQLQFGGEFGALLGGQMRDRVFAQLFNQFESPADQPRPVRADFEMLGAYPEQQTVPTCIA